MTALADTRTVLETAANQILALVAPTTARLVHAYVTVAEEAETAATDGVHIWVPTTFEDVDVTQNIPVAIGLLVHELGHFLQPLKELEAVERRTGCPHWLGNVVMDIQLEAMMAGLFPELADTLTVVRTAIKKKRAPEYVQTIRAGKTFPDIACSLALLGRYGTPARPFDCTSNAPVGCEIGRLPYQISHPAWSFVSLLGEADSCATDEIGDLIERIMEEFPELRQAPETQPVPGGGLEPGVAGTAAAAQAEAQGNVAQHQPIANQPLLQLDPRRLPASADVLRTARGLRLHFQSARGATEIVAPARLDRRAAALDEVVPFRMSLPGREVPAPKLVICLDKSGSMRGQKFELAQQAAQAVAIACKEACGEVVSVLFDDSGFIGLVADDGLLYAAASGLSMGGTNFAFLIQIWRRWPQHRVLLVTDGDGNIPLALPGDKARTSALLIPPDAEEATMKQIAAHVVTISDLRELANIMALLTPRR